MYGQIRKRKSEAKARRKGGGGGGSWSNSLKFTPVPVKIHLRKPETPFVDADGDEEQVKYIEQHWIPRGGGGKPSPMTCGTVEQMPCVACAYTDPQAFGLTDVEPIAYIASADVRPGFVAEGWVEGWFHIVDQPGKDNKVYKVREACKGQKCQHCRNKVEKVFGRRFFSVLSPTAWTEVFARAEQQISSNCHCGGKIYYPEWLCPSCNAVLFKPDGECACGSTNVEFVQNDEGTIEAECSDCHSTWGVYPFNNEDLANRVENVEKCPECGKEVYLEPVLACTGTDEAECATPEPYDIFDAQLTVRKASEEQTASLVIDSFKIREPDERLFLPEHQLGSTEEVDRMKAHIDVAKLFKPMGTNEQATQLKEKDPFVTGGHGSSVRTYKRNEEEEE